MRTVWCYHCKTSVPAKFVEPGTGERDVPTCSVCGSHIVDFKRDDRIQKDMDAMTRYNPDGSVVIALKGMRR